ncbi:hypothetical protein BABINDRAFT_164581 [Babjeviella inositovora NRRL Y-12698]|uniref:Uncharacterized protein n=1 Tax=Babjeviella inositovora NRRL Y-12698 TaxID=984486 RepID=A0A1E3QYZ0_9ASCO|nr:uncharacterized protein BABINDRAFT_164581 [Babjeviella inositovora NRRL Y-12698]ODQ82848.1 hypothetical protein BABINDRAFT_164581 [Babjeviella inositovora NRRL Y-12698]
MSTLKNRSVPTASDQQKNASPIRRRLYTHNEIPKWQQDNHYILDGYVKQTNSLHRCFESLFYIHNESGNIHSHLFPGLAASAALCTSFCYFDRLFPVYPTTTHTDKFVLSLFMCGLISCLTLSATYHCIKCHSPAVSVRFNKLDYVGIIGLTSTSMTSIIYYSFIDLPVAYHASFFTMIGAFSLGCFVMSVDSRFRRPEWRPTRAAMFIMFGLTSIFPIFVGIIKFGLENTWKRSLLTWVLGEAVLYISGAVLYALRWPERQAPGKFDYFGHSHQIFHVMVVLAAASHATGLYKCYQYCHEVTLATGM